MLIAVGDSVTAGHNSPQGGVTECKDLNYSYARSVFEAMQQSLPSSWRDPSWAPGATLPFYDQYRNLAYSGFTTAKVILGGEDACDMNYDSPLNRAVDLLEQPGDGRSHTWNSVVMNVGINDTNWAFILEMMATAPPPFDCSWASEWDLEARQSQIQQNSSYIYRSLIAVDSGVRITRTGGYNMGGTGPLNRWPTCVSQIQPGVDRFDAVVFDESSLTSQERAHVFNQPIQSLLNARDDRIQTFNTGNFTTGAWPHPNPNGHSAIASAIPIRYAP